MVSFYLFLTGCYLYYTRSKYFTGVTRPVNREIAKWLWIPLFISATSLLIRNDGWVSGLLLAVVTCSLALMLVQFASVLGKNYFYGLAVLVHGLVLLEILI